MAAQTKLSRSLYRSLYRWSRQPSVKEATLGIDPTLYGVPSDLLQETGFKKKDVLTSVEDMRKLMGKLFRLPLTEDKANEALDGALQSLPRWYNEGAVLNQRYGKRVENSQIDTLALRSFRVGEVVMHKESQTRHVVIGWEVEDGVQYIRTLSDHLDAQNSVLGKIDKDGNTVENNISSMSSEKDNVNASGGINCVEFELVENLALMRILNENVNDYFEGYDNMLQRYIPNSHLSYSYPLDYALPNIAGSAFVKLQHEKLQLEPHPNGIEGYIADVHAANTKSRMRDEHEMYFVAMSLKGMLTSVNSQLQEILDKHEIDTNAVIDTVEKTANVLDTSAVTRLVLDSLYELINKLKTIEKDLEEVEINHHAVDSPAKSLYANTAIFESVSTLSSLLVETEKMLSFRWQTKGHVHFEQEMQRRLDLDHEAANESDKSAVVEPLEPTYTPPIYRVGEVVRTKKFGWRGAIISIHLRPDAPDADKWDGVVDTPSQADQPFYRVLPEESDMQEGTSILARLVAEENLEFYDHAAHGNSGSMNGQAKNYAEVDALQATWQIENRWMHRYFTGFDVEQSRYIPKQKLQFVFPDNAAQSDEEVGETADIAVSLKEIPWLPIAKEPTIDGEGNQVASSPTDFDTGRIPQMESDLKNILATVNSKQVHRLRTERRQASLERTNGHKFGPNLDEIQSSAQAGHKLAETVLMEVFKCVREIFSRCREGSVVKGDIATEQNAEDEHPTKGSLKPYMCPHDPAKMNLKSLASSGVNLDSTRDDGVPALHMSHLNFLLRTARRREDAISVESVMWMVWMAHPDWRVSTEMMQGNNYLQLGRTAEAMTFFQNAAELDPHYSEPYNKMAAASLRLEEYEECEMYADKALKLCPTHYAAMAGLGTALEKRGYLGTAAHCLERTLAAHPFAGHVPTFLSTVLRRVEADRVKAMESVLASIEKNGGGPDVQVTVVDPSDDVETLVAKVEEISSLASPEGGNGVIDTSNSSEKEKKQAASKARKILDDKKRR